MNKMSTSLSSEQGAVYIDDTPEAILKKFKSAVTDSGREVRYDPREKPGVSNLLEIMSVATGEPIDALEKRFPFELRDEVCAIDDQGSVYDRSPRSKADIVHLDELEI